MATAADLTTTSSEDSEDSNDHLITSTDPDHPANLICTLCRNFYSLGWVTGTGGGTSIAQGSHIYIAPSGVQKELMQPSNMFVMDRATHSYLRKPLHLNPSACTPLFLAAFDRGARCCIHTHSQWAVLVTLLVEKDAKASDLDPNNQCFEIEQIEQIKGIPKGRGKPGMLGYFDLLKIPIIENTAHEEDLTQSLEQAMDKYPDTYAVLVRRHGVYVWGDNVQKAKTQAESLDYIFRLAVEMRNLGLPWTQSSAVQDSAQKRGRGRPRKTPMSSTKTVNHANSNATPSRGRPKRGLANDDEARAGESKDQNGASLFLTPVDGTDSDDGGSFKKRRGRPRKSETDA